MYGITTILEDADSQTAFERVSNSLAANGFGALTSIDV